jgi:hypothetical protein
MVIQHTGDQFSRLLVVGVMAWLSTQMIINVGAMLGLLPLKGITLPLISQGGTSLIFLTAALGLVFQVSRYTSYNAQNQQQSKKTPVIVLTGGGSGGHITPLLSLAHALKNKKPELQHCLYRP